MAMKKNHNQKHEGAGGKTPTKGDFKRESKKALGKGAKYVLVAIGVSHAACGDRHGVLGDLEPVPVFG